MFCFQFSNTEDKHLNILLLSVLHLRTRLRLIVFLADKYHVYNMKTYFVLLIEVRVRGKIHPLQDSKAIRALRIQVS